MNRPTDGTGLPELKLEVRMGVPQSIHLSPNWYYTMLMAAIPSWEQTDQRSKP